MPPARMADIGGVIFTTPVSILLGIAGILFTVMFIVGGYQYLNVGANKEAATRALHTITFAVIGLVVTLSSWMIIYLLGRFLGIPNFGIVNICIHSPC